MRLSNDKARLLKISKNQPITARSLYKTDFSRNITEMTNKKERSGKTETKPYRTAFYHSPIVQNNFKSLFWQPNIEPEWHRLC